MAAGNQQYFWNGSTWVDNNGFDTARAMQPAPQPTQQTGQAAGTTNIQGQQTNYGDRPDPWGADSSGWVNGWERSRDLTGDLFKVYRDNFSNVQKLEQDRNQLYQQFMQTLNSPQGEYQRMYQNISGMGAGQAENAANQALAYGGDANAAALNARNSNAVAANKEAAQVYDPRLKDQRVAAAMAMQEALANPLWADMLERIMQYDLGREGNAIADPNNRPKGGFGEIIGSILGAGTGAGLNWGKVFS